MSICCSCICWVCEWKFFGLICERLLQPTKKYFEYFDRKLLYLLSLLVMHMLILLLLLLWHLIWDRCLLHLLHMICLLRLLVIIYRVRWPIIVIYMMCWKYTHTHIIGIIVYVVEMRLDCINIFYGNTKVPKISSVVDGNNSRLHINRLHVDSTYQDRRPCHYTFDWDSVVVATFDTVDRAFDATASAFGIDPFDVGVIAASFA